jgi:hypothetical protein
MKSIVRIFQKIIRFSFHFISASETFHSCNLMPKYSVYTYALTSTKIGLEEFF